MSSLTEEIRRLAGAAAPQVVVDRLAALASLIGKEGRAMGLTGRTSQEDVVAYDLPDAVAAASVMDASFGEHEHARVLDFGTGAGLPGLPLAILRPNLTLDLVDRKESAVSFARAACRAIAVENAEFHVKPLPPYDAMLARAVYSPERTLKTGLALVRARGFVCLMTGGDPGAALAAAAEGQLGVAALYRYLLPGGGGRCIVVVENLLKGHGFHASK